MDTNYFRDWKTLGKRRSENQIIGESGIDILRSLFPKEWVIREYTADYGIDLDVELFEECNDGVYVTKGEHVLFQVKTTNDIEVKDLEVYSKTKSDNCIFKVVKYPLDTALLATVEKMGSAVPVLLCLVDNVEREGYFVCLNDYVDKILISQKPDYDRQGTVTINIPIENRISSGKFAIEWYGKRAKLYSFFNLVNCQKRDLLYTPDCNLEQMVEMFLNRICRLDIWSDKMLELFKEQIDYYTEHHSTKQADIIINNAIERGENVDEPIWEGTYCMGEVSFRHATQIQELHRLWDQMCIISDMGISSGHKYEHNGEGYLKRMCDILKKYSSNPMEDQLKLWDICVFNYLIGNTDNHIKNVSLLYASDMASIRLAPAYDIVCTMIYPSSTTEMAVSIGCEYDIHKIKREHFCRELKNIGIGEKLAMKHYDDMLSRIESALEKSCETLMQQGFIQAKDMKKRILEVRKLAWM